MHTASTLHPPPLFPKPSPLQQTSVDNNSMGRRKSIEELSKIFEFPATLPSALPIRVPSTRSTITTLTHSLSNTSTGIQSSCDSLISPFPLTDSECSVVPPNDHGRFPEVSVEAGCHAEVKKCSKSLVLQKVIEEIKVTEELYFRDLSATQKIYFEKAVDILAKSDIRVIFSNLLDLVDLSREFVKELNSCPHNATSISRVFIEFASRMDTLYSDYCKRQEESILRVQELERESEAIDSLRCYLNFCKKGIKELTPSPPELSSMLVKPVQRILKYPLLLQELKNNAPVLEHPEVETAIQTYKIIASHINEVKRRKDLVDKIVNGRGAQKSLQHGINKSLNRRTQQLKQATGLISVEPTSDRGFQQLALKLVEKEQLLHQLKQDMHQWSEACTAYMEYTEKFAVSWTELFSISPGDTDSGAGQAFHRVREWRSHNYRTLNTGLAVGRQCSRLDEHLDNHIFPQVEQLLEFFVPPLNVVKKREKKSLDLDHVRECQALGKVADDHLLASSKEYGPLNDQLIEELPQFFRLINCATAMTIGRFVKEVMVERWYGSQLDVLRKLISEDPSDRQRDVVKEFCIRREKDGISSQLQRISILRRPQLAKIDTQNLIIAEAAFFTPFAVSGVVSASTSLALAGVSTHLPNSALRSSISVTLPRPYFSPNQLRQSECHEPASFSQSLPS